MSSLSLEREKRRERIEALGYDYDGQPKEHIYHCNLCAGQIFTILTHQDRYGFAAEAHACLRCGLVFLNPVMTVEAYRDFYVDVYRPLVSAYHGRQIDAQTIQGEQEQYAVERGRFLEPFLTSLNDGTLLDIGGSTGVVAKYLAQKFGLQATVLDPSPDELVQAERLGLETIASLLEDYEPENDRYDLIILCQTVDHLLDVRGAMDKIRSLLKGTGWFFIDIVDFRAAYLRNWQVEEAVKIDHPYYLTEATIEAYLKRAGFEFARKAYAADHLHVSYICRLASPDPEYLPPQDTVEKLLNEVRAVQNAPKGRLD
jgi:2-polyprenyl-3-methyl-5-hydroxy-6-metoxy-1,4-benzoquinol methylase